MEKKKKMLDVIFILDRSGSMSGSEENTISSFNEYLEKERHNDFKTNITTVLFSDDFEYLYKRDDVKDVRKLTRKEYYVNGCTALYDAIGSSINYIDNCDTDKVMFIIITDGYENASREFNQKMVKKMIKKHSKYEFIYIGADIDSYEAGSEIGIAKDNIANYKKSKRGLSLLFKSIGNFEDSMMDEGEVCYDRSMWKKELDDYIDDNME
ncbi:MAG: VWA domain-containing protein [Bacilli bacterium]|nr:VWA domain-containing protein [Bacilli bacterium]